MTTTTSEDRTTTASRIPLLATIGIGLSIVLTAVGTFVGENDTGDASRDEAGTWLYVVGIALVAALVVFGLVVRTAAEGNAGRRAVVLGIVALLSVVVFWAGVTTVLAAGAVACALTERDRRGALSGASKAALGLASLATTAVVILAFVG